MVGSLDGTGTVGSTWTVGSLVGAGTVGSLSGTGIEDGLGGTGSCCVIAVHWQFLWMCNLWLLISKCHWGLLRWQYSSWTVKRMFCDLFLPLTLLPCFPLFSNPLFKWHLSWNIGTVFCSKKLRMAFLRYQIGILNNSKLHFNLVLTAHPLATLSTAIFLALWWRSSS